MRLYSVNSGFLDIIPELDYTGIRSAPHLNNIRKLILSYASLQSTHSHERVNRASITKCQFRNFAFCSQVSVLSILNNRDTEHLRGGSAVNIFVVSKNLLPPPLTGEPCKYTRLDS